MDLDRTDFELLRLLQENARLSNKEIARQVGLAPSTCLVRTRLLQQSGAITGFKAHLQKYPQGQYADNAAYWLGEASYVKRDYKSAAEAFNRVATQHPQSPRAPDAMFKLALTQQELKQDAEARTTLEQVISRYPNSNAARLAQQRLQGGN